MSVFDAILLGIIQGLTEFLPISSSGHLVWAQAGFGIGEPNLTFDLILHTGTTLAVLWFLRQEVAGIFQGMTKAAMGAVAGSSFRMIFQTVPNFRLGIWVGLACIPTAIIGLAFLDYFEKSFSQPRTVAWEFLANGVLLWATRWCGKPTIALPSFRPFQAIVIGAAQGLAIVPGISRSGATIGAGLFLGLERELAVRFSFLLSIPAIAGAFVLEWLRHPPDGSVSVPAGVVGFGVSFGVGYLSLAILMWMVRRAQLHQFAWYCWAVGLLGLWIF